MGSYHDNDQRLSLPVMAKADLLSTSGLSLGYQNTTIVSNVEFNLALGDVFAVVGHNGSGKSTLVKTLLGNLSPVSGTLNWHQGRPKTIAYLGQQTDFDNRFPIRVKDLVAMGEWSKLGLGGRIDRECQKRIDEALERTGTSYIADMPLYKLSAGQLQRSLFARTMVQDAELILLDEPFTAVDQTTEAELLALIDDWAADGRAVLMVLHDLSAVLQHCNSALLLGAGRSIFGSPEEALAPDNLVALEYLSESQASWLKGMYSNMEKTDV